MTDDFEEIDDFCVLFDEGFESMDLRCVDVSVFFLIFCFFLMTAVFGPFLGGNFLVWSVFFLSVSFKFFFLGIFCSIMALGVFVSVTLSDAFVFDDLEPVFLGIFCSIMALGVFVSVTLSGVFDFDDLEPDFLRFFGEITGSVVIVEEVPDCFFFVTSFDVVDLVGRRCFVDVAAVLFNVSFWYKDFFCIFVPSRRDDAS